MVAASVARFLGSSPVVNNRSFIASDGQFDIEMISVDLPAAPGEAYQQAWDEIGALCRPARDEPKGEELIAIEWAKTVAVTAGSQRQGVDEDLALETIVAEMANYPLDCVLRSMRATRNGSRWRPTLNELILDVEWRAKYRKHLRSAFRRMGVEA